MHKSPELSSLCKIILKEEIKTIINENMFNKLIIFEMMRTLDPEYVIEKFSKDKLRIDALIQRLIKIIENIEV